MIKGLKSGLFCMHVCGNSKERTAYAKDMKDLLDEGIVVREIRNAPRDARYKIDWYFKKGIDTEHDTIDFDYINFHENLLKYLGIDESFNPTIDLKKAKSYKCDNDFELCYGSKKGVPYFEGAKESRSTGYYFKYKGKACDLIFDQTRGLVDYSEPFWSKYEGYVHVFNKFDTMLHNIIYYMYYFNFNIKGI